MYDFLNRRYYLGGSFAGWFWHYAPWGAVITALIVGACLLIIFPSRDGDGDEYVRGTDVIPSRRLRRDLRGDGVELGGILIPRKLESQHFLLVGAPGSGKSTAIRRMLRQIEARGDERGRPRSRVRVRARVLSPRARRPDPQPARYPLPVVVAVVGAQTRKRGDGRRGARVGAGSRPGQHLQSGRRRLLLPAVGPHSHRRPARRGQVQGAGRDSEAARAAACQAEGSAPRDARRGPHRSGRARAGRRNRRDGLQRDQFVSSSSAIRRAGLERSRMGGNA